MADDDDKITYLVPVPTHAPEAELLDAEAPNTEAPEEVPEEEDDAARLASLTSSSAQSEADKLAEAQQALARINRATYQLWDDWVTVGEALVLGRIYALYVSGAKGPKGKSYSRTFSAWLKSYGFDGIDETTRAHLLKVMDDRAEVYEWRIQLSRAERQKWNHPSTVWKHFNAWKRREGKRPPPKRSPLKASLENTIRERDEANAKVEEAQAQVARLKREREDDGPLMTRNDEPADIARVIYDWLPERKRVAFGRDYNKLVKNPPRPSPLPKPPEPIGPRRHRALLPVEPEDATEEE